MVARGKEQFFEKKETVLKKIVRNNGGVMKKFLYDGNLCKNRQYENFD